MQTPDLEIIKKILADDKDVKFAYLYGSFVESDSYADIDIAVYAAHGCDPLRLSADLKLELSGKTGLAVDFYDVRVINGLVENGDIFTLIFLKRIFEKNILLADKDFETRTEFIEKYGLKYRTCEGLIDEVIR